MTISSDEAVIESFLEQVEAQCADLPVDVCQRLLGNLANHLRELDGPDLLAACADPEAYVSELREALNLGPASTKATESPTTRAPSKPVLRRWLFAGVLAIVMAAAGAAIGMALTDGSSAGPSRPPGRGDGSTRMPAPQVELPVPDVVGLTADAAELQLVNAGLKAAVRSDGAPGQASRVISQDPKPNATIKAGATVTIYLGSP